jgi:ribosomal protein S18 acetylase RimI-like enzyme
MGIEFRWADESDLPLIHVCDERASVHEGRRLELLRAVRQRSCLLAMREGPLGFAVLDHSFFGHGFISLICVAPAHRGRGIGLALISQVERHCLTSKLFTSTNASNERARRLFATAGFVPSGYIENLDDGDPECIFFKTVAPASRVT